MANTLGVYNPIFYAQEALIHLEKALGMAGRVHRGYDAERRAFRQGETINIRKPSTFTAANAPATAADLATETVSITLSNWKEVKFALTDKELAFTGERIIADHIRPAAYALADNIDQAIAALYYKVPWYYDLNATVGSVVSDITGPRKILRDNAVPLEDGSVFYMVNPALEAGLLANSAFTQWQGAGMTGVESQRRGTLGTRFGVEIFANQNVPSHTPGVAADATGAIDLGAGYAKGATTIHVDGVTAAGTFKAGDTFSIAGDTQRYSITADATADGTGDVDFTIYPALAQAVLDNAIVTISLDTHVSNLMYHRNAFALVTAPLSEMGNELGARIATVQDPVTGLALRSRVYYIGNSSVVHVALDVLYGVQILDGNLAVRARG